MPLDLDTLVWEGQKIGKDPSKTHLFLDGGVEGWGQPGFNTPSTPMQMGGEWGGTWTTQAATYTANLWMDVDGDLSKFRAFRSSMKLRPNPSDEIPLAWSGLLWDGEVRAYVRPTRCVPIVDEDAVEDGVVGWDAQWLSTDGVVYSNDHAERRWETGSPVTSDTFPVGNAGDLVPWARRAWRWRMTAHGTVTNPRIRVEHLDGTFEQVVFEGLTMTGGQVLTIGDDMTPRVNSRIVTGYVRSTTQRGGPSRAPIWPRLHGDDDSGDEANEVTVAVSSGSFSGFCQTRSTY